LSFYEGVGVGVLKIEESEWEVLKIKELELELLCTNSTALLSPNPPFTYVIQSFPPEAYSPLMTLKMEGASFSETLVTNASQLGVISFPLFI
jgi:hypothetical protein